MKEESATVALLKFRLQKNVKTGKRPLTVAGLINLVQRFEETGLLKDRVRSGRPSLRQTRSAFVASRNWKHLRQNPLQGLAVHGQLADA
ncbi:hypothetical protein NPIL_699101 [Nephila pilipes]|uniref:DUF4817 domain-containing protein n=1 Tax=Nephila pilipes TaxID=299642 RepID=A0A8X6THF1_NEPPI|nr:hypothetical protein NPIL_699101 [Nephila pilipes]